MYVGDGEEKEHEVRVNKCKYGEKLDKLVCQQTIFVFHRKMFIFREKS